MTSHNVDDSIERLLDGDRALVVAAAGCGKTELIARAVAHERAGRQLVLTHTHAGVAALKRRFEKLRVPADRYHLDTIAGWSLRYAAAYPAISGVQQETSALPEWPNVYPGAERVLESAVGPRVVAASYDGALVDEYQDCSAAQHAIVTAVAEAIPVRVVGDPLQAIFGFRRDDPLAPWRDVEQAFPRLTELVTPWRWQSANRQLGSWLVAAREELQDAGTLTIDASAPVDWEPWSADTEIKWCSSWKGNGTDRAVAIKKWSIQGRNSCLLLATRLGGWFQLVEAFDDRELPAMAESWATASGEDVVASLHGYARERMIKVGPELNDLVEAIARGRSTARFRTHLDHRDRLERLARQPTPGHVLAVLDGFKAERGWTVYRPEGYYQLRTALLECIGLTMEAMAEAVAVVRTRARHRGRLIPIRTLGTPLLLKGLECEDALVLDADELSRNELYVAITRGARSLRILSRNRVIRPSS